ncbi:MAG: MarR family transcriptional regulator [Pseudomonadota bacterium]
MPKSAKTPGTPAAPFDDFGFVEACRELHAAVDQLDSSVAKMVGISRNDLRCLNLLETEPRSPGAIAVALKLTTGSVTTLLDRLESLDLVERRPAPHDRRALLIYPTAKCFQEIGPVYKSFALSLIEHANGYSRRDRDIALATLRDVTALCLEACPPVDGDR